MRFSEAFTTTYRELRNSLRIEEHMRPWLAYLLLLIPFCGAGFAYRDYGRVNVFASFLGGCISGPVILFGPFVALFAGAIFTVFTIRVLNPKLGYRKFEPGAGSMALLLFYSSLVFFLVVSTLSRLPVVGNQLAQLLPD
jgi:hypothetical protein